MIELPSEVIGFHGTNHAAVPHLLVGDIGQSDEHFEWLGSGFYLWQDSPWRAQEWALDRFGDEAAFVAVRVSLAASTARRWESFPSLVVEVR